MKQRTGRPYADTRLVKFLERRISDLRPTKTQIAIATEAGFRSPNMLPMIKNGSAKLPLDRVPGLAKALDCDPALLFRMAVEQLATDTTSLTIGQIFGALITENERAWILTIREASGNSDPSLTARAQKAIWAIFGK
ncbi:XRE family transcriptional regulator [Mesorhizobium sp. ZC-5]|uniref:XRE family transcriptional regulator n=1 Tax=Mesorhizobium sp. ZC-5 TaxID=2986066 RepID=UPI0021E7561F|nr:XRE family transcriptional regulator [Mesorhizobium sp. ZC-5]MCV3243288.1 XRE family transcriptional regulator [Mesorhizobium sp. ZC-5]